MYITIFNVCMNMCVDTILCEVHMNSGGSLRIAPGFISLEHYPLFLETKKKKKIPLPGICQPNYLDNERQGPVSSFFAHLSSGIAGCHYTFLDS